MLSCVHVYALVRIRDKIDITTVEEIWKQKSMFRWRSVNKPLQSIIGEENLCNMGRRLDFYTSLEKHNSGFTLKNVQLGCTKQIERHD